MQVFLLFIRGLAFPIDNLVEQCSALLKLTGVNLLCGQLQLLQHLLAFLELLNLADQEDQLLCYLGDGLARNQVLLVEHHLAVLLLH